MARRYDLEEAQYEAALAAFRAAVAKADGQTPFANICRCTQGNISQLLSNGSLLPERYVIKVEAATGVPREDLRPDIYPRSHKHEIANVTDNVAFERQPLLNVGRQ